MSKKITKAIHYVFYKCVLFVIKYQDLVLYIAENMFTM